MIGIIAQFAIYYRDVPVILEGAISADVGITTTKDGLKKYSEGHSAPRLTLTMTESQAGGDKKRVKQIEAILETLEKNNQIVGFRRIR